MLTTSLSRWTSVAPIGALSSRAPAVDVRGSYGSSSDERCDGAMNTCWRAAFCWALLCLAGSLAAPRRLYCERADVAWRAYRAPAAFEARVQSVAKGAATVKVQRVFRHQGRWPAERDVIRLKLPQENLQCSGRFEVPLQNHKNYIVFAERKGHAAVALGPPLRRTGNLVKRIRAVYRPGYSECLVFYKCMELATEVRVSVRFTNF
ncbi:unnamed protein product, partial [Brenthis ino]